MRHWHTHEEEFIFVLSGEVVLRTDARRASADSRACARGFRVGDGRRDGHQLVNRGNVPAVYLEVSNRDPRDQAFYSDVDLHFHGEAAAVRFTRKDGSGF